MLEIKMEGDWDRIRAFMQNLKGEAQEAYERGAMKVGLKAEALAKGHISRQDLPWPPLKPATIAKKIRNGHSENILIETSTYFQSITTWKQGEAILVGVSRTVRNADNEEVANIARTHEYGSKSGNIPARPLWGPVLEEVRQWNENVRPVEQEFKKSLKKYGINL